VSIARMHALMPGEPAEAVVNAAPVYLRGTLPALDAPPERERLQCIDVVGLTSLHASSGRGITDVSFALERGTFTVVTGRIGAGKTTLLHTLLGLLPRDGGEVRWNGRVVDDPATFLVPPRAAFTPQVPRLFSESLHENLLLGTAEGEAGLWEAVEAAVMEDDVAGFDDGLETFVGPRGVRLSGGQVQRAAAARMFVRAPELLVFDDLSSALDATTEAELWRRLFARGRDLTCIVVSHSPVALAHADRVVVLDGGRVVDG
jgi:ATP-binding cassette subfamily B protein